MANLKSTRLGTTDLVKDPAETLKDYIKTAFDGTTDPKLSEVEFQTKWDLMSKHNLITIENMPAEIKIEDNGAGRFVYHDVFRVQVYAELTTAKDKRWKMEKLIASKINANPTGMTADGIEEAFITVFTPIPSHNLDSTNPEAQNTTVERSYAMVTLLYYKFVS